MYCTFVLTTDRWRWRWRWRWLVSIPPDPVRIKSFQQFANTTETENGIEWKTERGQRRPVDWAPAASRSPWKARHLLPGTIQLEGEAGAGGAAPSVEIEDEHGVQTVKNWALGWVEVGDAADWPAIDGGAAVKHGKSQLAVFNFSSRGEWYATQNMSPDTRTFALSRGMVGDKGGVPHVADPILKKTVRATIDRGSMRASVSARPFIHMYAMHYCSLLL
eukprot:SAG22_NODE_147_length_17533_cov_46.384536_8_plen_219_part_00